MATASGRRRKFATESVFCLIAPAWQKQGPHNILHTVKYVFNSCITQFPSTAGGDNKISKCECKWQVHDA